MNCSYECESGSCGVVPRAFLTKEEKIEMLEKYKEDLENEVQGITERVTELKKEK